MPAPIGFLVSFVVFCIVVAVIVLCVRLLIRVTGVAVSPEINLILGLLLLLFVIGALFAWAPWSVHPWPWFAR